MGVSGADLRRVFAFLGTVRVGSPADPLPRATLVALRDLIGADEAEYFELRRADRAVLAVATSDDFVSAPGSDDALLAFGGQNPVEWRRWSPQHGAIRLSDQIGARALRRLEFYQEVMRPNGLRDILKIWLASDAYSVTCVQLWRHGTDFSRRQQDLLGILQQDLITLRSSALAQRPSWSRDGVSVTAREAEVLLWAVRGYSRAEIAALLGSTPGTVAKHLEHAYQRLEVRSRAQAIDRILFSGPEDPPAD